MSLPEWQSFSHLNGNPPIFQAIVAERRYQDDVHGPSTERKGVSLAIWKLALDEETGEVARALLNLRSEVRKVPSFKLNEEHLRDRLRTELIQVAALAWAMCEALDSGSVVE